MLQTFTKILEPITDFVDLNGDIHWWLKESASVMAPTQISPISTFHNGQTSNLYGSLDMGQSPSSTSTFAGASAFPYFYSVADDESTIDTVGVSKIVIRFDPCEIICF